MVPIVFMFIKTLRMEGVLCMGLGFAQQGWVHEVALP